MLVGEGVAVAVAVLVAVAVSLGVGVAVCVGGSVCMLVAVALGIVVAVSVGATVAVAVGAPPPPSSPESQPAISTRPVKMRNSGARARRRKLSGSPIVSPSSCTLSMFDSEPSIRLVSGVRLVSGTPYKRPVQRAPRAGHRTLLRAEEKGTIAP